MIAAWFAAWPGFAGVSRASGIVVKTKLRVIALYISDRGLHLPGQGSVLTHDVHVEVGIDPVSVPTNP